MKREGDNTLAVLAEKIEKEKIQRMLDNELYSEAFSKLLLFEKKDFLVDLSF